ncbi:MAG: PssE/Cps14G family polysaccharide biosynthesis glycosyltransferase [Methanosarcinales archaeon]
MIFVTVGQPRDFSRLVKKIDEIGGKIKEEIIIQRGETKYEPKNCKYFDFVSRDEFLKYVKKARIVITHAGVGTIITVLNCRKPIIVVPRRKKYNEHRNDHQMDIARELKRSGNVVVCYDVNKLEGKIRKLRKGKIVRKKEKLEIKEKLENFIEKVMR